ncbi:MAG: pirin family protein [Porphyromonas sp.]|nr:pirin family protein [Porphyromonas sp.]
MKRKVADIVRGHRAIDGAGVRLTRVLGIRTIKSFDPFLMLDGFDSKNPEDYIKGFPWHPHRGIETVTYLVSGEMEHSDSLGNKGVIRKGDTQWMSAGSGIIHQEMPVASEHLLGCQLWVNLPKKDKMSAPTYGDIRSEDIPSVTEEQATVKVISGKYGDTRGAFEPEHVAVTYLDVNLKPGATWSYAGTPNDETLFIYLLSGDVAVNEGLDNFEEKGCAIRFSASNENADEYETVEIKAGAEGARFVLLAGRPLKEPIAWGGPVVMNTNEELEQAFDEIDRGTFIKENAAL